MAGRTPIIMWPVYFFILWNTCFKCCSLAGIEDKVTCTTTFGLEQNFSLEGNDEVASDNLTIVEVGDSFEDQIPAALIPIESLNYTEQLEAMFSQSNHSLANSEWFNSTLNFIRVSERRMKERIREIKDIILLLFKNNGTLYVNSTQNEEMIANVTDIEVPDIEVFPTQKEELETSNVTLQNNTVDNGSVYGSEPDDESEIYVMKSLPEKVADWYNSYHNYSYELDTQHEKIWIEFADFKMEDIVIVPRGFYWVLCSDLADATLEIMFRLVHPSYPQSIKYDADFYLQLLLDAGGSYNASCVATGAMSLPVMYFDATDEPQHAVLENFLPTDCLCTDITTSTSDLNATTIPDELDEPL